MLNRTLLSKDNELFDVIVFAIDATISGSDLLADIERFSKIWVESAADIPGNENRRPFARKVRYFLTWNSFLPASPVVCQRRERAGFFDNE